MNTAIVCIIFTIGINIFVMMIRIFVKLQYDLSTKEDCALTDTHTRRLGKSNLLRRKLLHVHKLRAAHYFGVGESQTPEFISKQISSISTTTTTGSARIFSLWSKTSLA